MTSSPGVKQHTFYPGQFQQTIPELVNEETTYRKMTTTAKFMHDDKGEENKQNMNTATVCHFLSDSTDRIPQIQNPRSVPRDEVIEEILRNSSMSQGNFSKYFMGGGSGSNHNSKNVFAKYFDKNSIESGTDRVISARD